MIKIEQLLSLLKKGWVAMDENGLWCWYKTKPHRESSIVSGYWQSNVCERITMFDIVPVEDWTKSLMKCGVKK